jgi:flagellar protein FliL
VSTTTAAPAENETPPKAGKKKLIAIVLVLVAALGGAGWFFFLKPGGEEAPKPGAVAPLDPIQVNLAGGHYLRLGLALQLVEGAHEVDGSKALDAAITVFSGRPIGEVNQPETREHLRDELLHLVEEGYHHEVIEVYFTEYVTQ